MSENEVCCASQEHFRAVCVHGYVHERCACRVVPEVRLLPCPPRCHSTVTPSFTMQTLEVVAGNAKPRSSLLCVATKTILIGGANFKWKTGCVGKNGWYTVNVKDSVTITFRGIPIVWLPEAKGYTIRLWQTRNGYEGLIPVVRMEEFLFASGADEIRVPYRRIIVDRAVRWWSLWFKAWFIGDTQAPLMLGNVPIVYDGSSVEIGAHHKLAVSHAKADPSIDAALAASHREAEMHMAAEEARPKMGAREFGVTPEWMETRRRIEALSLALARYAMTRDEANHKTMRTWHEELGRRLLEMERQKP